MEFKEFADFAGLEFELEELVDPAEFNDLVFGEEVKVELVDECCSRDFLP